MAIVLDKYLTVLMDRRNENDAAASLQSITTPLSARSTQVGVMINHNPTSRDGSGSFPVHRVLGR
jgi:hypothetical protein